MKKALGLFAMLILLLFSIYSESQVASTSQTIAGFINHSGSNYMYLSVSYDVVSTDQSYSGINLDVSDSSNPNRYLIAPSTSHELGLRIGTLDLETTNRDYSLRIYHTPLGLKTNQGIIDWDTTIDYELSLMYAISGSDSLTVYCLSATNMDYNLPDKNTPDKMMNLALNSHGGVIIIQNAGFFFRLTDVSQVSTAGQYESSIYIRVGKE